MSITPTTHLIIARLDEIWVGIRTYTSTYRYMKLHEVISARTALPAHCTVDKFIGM